MTKPILLGLDLEAYGNFLQKVLSETHHFENFEGTIDELVRASETNGVTALLIEYGPTIPESERRLRLIRRRLPKLPIIVLTYYVQVPNIAHSHHCACAYIGSKSHREWEKSIGTLIERAQRLVA